MSAQHPKNPRTPPSQLTLNPSQVTRYDGQLWRIHTTIGTHPSAWNELRHYGPIKNFRWDPHSPPKRLHLDAGVTYTAATPITTFAEVFQDDRAITLTADRALSGWTPTRPLELLNLTTSDWAVHNGASASLPGAPKNTCRAWANAIWSQLSAGSDAILDGILAPSTVLGDPIVVLFPRATNAFPGAPTFSRALDHSAVLKAAQSASRRLRWPIW